MIKVKNISFSYNKGKEIFKDLSVEFNKNLSVIIGPNASGKSTLLKCIFGLLDYEGDIYWKDKSLKTIDLDKKSEIMVYLPQQDIQDTMLTVFETILLGRISSLSWQIKDEDLNKVYDAMRHLRILDIAEEYVSNLSGGQKKLVAIAQTLVRDPELIIMDEPTNNLDMQKQLELFEIIKQISSEKNIKFIIVLHDLNLASKYAEELIIMNKKGQRYISGKAKDVINKKMLEQVYGVKADIVEDGEGKVLVSANSSINKIDVFNLKQSGNMSRTNF